MSDLKLGTVPVLRAELHWPRTGVWHAELLLDTDTVPTGAQTLQTDDQTFSLQGTIVDAYSGEYQGNAQVRLVGGAAGLGKVLAARYYRNATVSLILNDLLRDVGETLSSTADSNTTGTQITTFTRDTSTAGTILDTLARAVPDTVWRVLADGTLYIGPEQWDAVTLPTDLDLINEEINQAARDYVSANPLLVFRPGVTLDSRHVERVHVKFDSHECLTRIFWSVQATQSVPPAFTPRDRTKAAFDAMVRQTTAQYFFHALFPADVVSQSDDDGTLEVTPDSPVLPHLTAVPIRPPFPGAQVKVAQHTRVLIAFEGGDVQRPIALLSNFDTAKLTELTITNADGAKIKIAQGGEITIDGGSSNVNVTGGQVILKGGTLAVARNSDSVKVTIPANSFIVAVAGSATGTLNPDPVDVTGTITQGNDDVLA